MSPMIEPDKGGNWGCYIEPTGWVNPATADEEELLDLAERVLADIIDEYRSGCCSFWDSYLVWRAVGSALDARDIPELRRLLSLPYPWTNMEKRDEKET